MSADPGTATSASSSPTDHGLLPPWSKGELPAPPPFGLRNLMRVIGPGAVLAATSIGGGEWLVGPATAVKYTASIFLIVTAAILFQVIFNLEAIRYTLYTGEPIYGGIMRLRPGPRFWAGFYAVVGFFQLGWPALAGGAAAAILSAFIGRPPDSPEDQAIRMWITIGLITVVVFILSFGGTIERMLEYFAWTMLALVFAFLIFINVAYVPWANWWTTFKGFFQFSGLPEPINWGLIGALAATAGSGGMGNLTITNWVRDKGFGMGSKVGAIPSAIGGHQIQLSHVGTVFEVNETSLGRWRQWMRYVIADQVWVWGVFCFLGMYLNVNLATSFIPHGTNLEGQGAGAYQAEYLKPIWPGFYFLTLFIGFWVLFKTQLGNTDILVRTVTDALWMSSEKLRSWRGGRIQRIYYLVLVVFSIWGVIAIRLATPMTLFKILANIAGMVLVIAGVQILIVNRRFLPRALRPPLWREAALVGCVAFYAFFSFWVIRSLFTKSEKPPLFSTIDIQRGEEQTVELSTGAKVKVKLVGVEEVRDTLRSALREARIKVEIDGQPVSLVSGNYRLPVTAAGVEIDCPATKGLYPGRDPFEDSWGLDKDVRLRLWPVGSPWAEPGTFVYPAGQPWFAGSTQAGNEPSYVDGGDLPSNREKIYYHSGFDMGGCEGLIDVIAATDGLVISAGGETLPEYPDLPYYTQKPVDGVYVLGAHGWLHRYVHLKSIDPGVRPGQRVKKGQRLGALGKEGGSGGWAHLHYDIKAKQPSGKWGVLDSYAFLWEAYLEEYKPPLIAVARPHHLVGAGDKVMLDGSRSWSSSGPVARFEWTFGDGTKAEGATVERAYPRPGSYSEVLKITDAEGNVDYDFAVVQVIDKAPDALIPPTIHASFAPAIGIRAGDPVTFKVRSFRTERGNETWDFGDGSPPVTVHSDGNADSHAPEGYAETVHAFTRPGHYLVRVEGTGRDGTTATAHLQVRVADRAPPSAEPKR